MAKRPKHVIYEGYTCWTNTWLGTFPFLYTPQEAASGRYSYLYRWLKSVVFPFVASAHKVGDEKIRVIIKLPNN